MQKQSAGVFKSEVPYLPLPLLSVIFIYQKTNVTKMIMLTSELQKKVIPNENDPYS
jgi:hypothetical protein